MDEQVKKDNHAILPGMLLSGAMIVMLAAVPLPARAQDNVSPEARQAVIYGEVTDVDRSGMTVRFGGREVKVDAGAVTGEGSLRDFYREGMFVSVEGTLKDEDEIEAAAITRRDPYRATPPVPPYIANDAIITPNQLGY